MYPCNAVSANFAFVYSMMLSSCGGLSETPIAPMLFGDDPSAASIRSLVFGVRCAASFVISSFAGVIGCEVEILNASPGFDPTT
jgi:hypothetical protein